MMVGFGVEPGSGMSLLMRYTVHVDDLTVGKLHYHREVTSMASHRLYTFRS